MYRCQNSNRPLTIRSQLISVSFRIRLPIRQILQIRRVTNVSSSTIGLTISVRAIPCGRLLSIVRSLPWSRLVLPFLSTWLNCFAAASTAASYLHAHFYWSLESYKLVLLWCWEGPIIGEYQSLRTRTTLQMLSKLTTRLLEANNSLFARFEKLRRHRESLHYSNRGLAFRRGMRILLYCSNIAMWLPTSGSMPCVPPQQETKGNTSHQRRCS
jgi:hypothetical protein